jgi:diguanylate cyclase
MPSAGTAFVAGTVMGCVLVALGGFVGFVWGRRKGRLQMAGIDTDRVLQLLQELSTWTNEYSGNVSQYQDELGELRDAMRGSAQSNSPETARIAASLERIMQNNRSLQERLEAAEKQLEKQTKQIEEYLSEARTDGLTGLPNRRAFDKKFDEMFAQFRRGGRSFCLALVDIDHFKLVNDQWGHSAGDQVLRQTARMLADQFEGAYIVARFGGEEFAALLPVPLSVAAERVDRTRKLVARQPIAIENRSIPVSVSIGLAEPREDQVIGPIVRRADEALYAAKGRGRNRVYYHDGRQPVLVGAPEIAK